MRYFLSGLLLLTGILTLALSFRMHSELRAMATAPTVTLNGTMVRHIIPNYPPGANPKPVEVASAITRRIYGIGAVGLVFMLGAFVMLFMLQPVQESPADGPSRE